MRGFSEDKDIKQVCGTCLWHTKDRKSDDWVCANMGSIYHKEVTDYGDYCTEWEENK